MTRPLRKIILIRHAEKPVPEQGVRELEHGGSLDCILASGECSLAVHLLFTPTPIEAAQDFLLLPQDTGEEIVTLGHALPPWAME